MDIIRVLKYCCEILIKKISLAKLEAAPLRKNKLAPVFHKREACPQFWIVMALLPVSEIPFFPFLYIKLFGFIWEHWWCEHNTFLPELRTSETLLNTYSWFAGIQTWHGIKDMLKEDSQGNPFYYHSAQTGRIFSPLVRKRSMSFLQRVHIHQDIIATNITNGKINQENSSLISLRLLQI